MSAFGKIVWRELMVANFRLVHFPVNGHDEQGRDQSRPYVHRAAKDTRI
jgi:hypothetical protein